MLPSLHLHEKSREVCINARPPPASLPFKGQVTEQTTVKWSIDQILTYRGFIAQLEEHHTGIAEVMVLIQL